MAPIAVKTYKGKGKNKRPWANIQNVLSEIKNNNKESIPVFEALFTKNIKGLKSKRTGKNRRNKENNSHMKQLPFKRTVDTKLDIINVTPSVQDAFLDSTFDRILVGPVFQQPRLVDVSHKSKEFSGSSIITLENQSVTRSSASDSSYVDTTLFPVTWKTRKKLGVPKTRKIFKCVSGKANPSSQFRKNKKDTLDINPCITSTPNGICCREKKQNSPFLSPILHIDQKRRTSKVINDETEDKKSPVCSSASLSKSHGAIPNASNNILPEIHQLDPSLKGSNVSNELSPPSVVEESASKCLCKFALNNVDSCHVSAGAILSDSLTVIEDVCSQLQSCKLDGKIVSAIASPNELYGSECGLKKSTQSFMCKDQKFDVARQSFMNGSKDTVCGSGSSQSLPVHHCTDTNLRNQKNRWTKSAGRNLSISDDSCAEDLLGFSDVPVDDDLYGGLITGGVLGPLDVPVEQYSCEDPITGGILCPSDIPIEQDSLENPVTDVLPPIIKTPNADSNKCAAVNGVVEGVKVIPNFPSSESRNVSVELFDTWDSGNCTKSGTTFERPKTRKIFKCVSGKANPPLQFRKKKKDTLDIKPCITSTPNGICCREKNQISPFLCPILHIDQKRRNSKVINDKTEDKKSPVCSSASLSKSHGAIPNASNNILPEIHQLDPSLKGSNVSNELSPPSVVEESASKCLCKFALNNVDSCHVSAGAILSDSLTVIEDVCSQLQSCKLDGKIVSAIASPNELYGSECGLKKSTQSFMCKDQKFDVARQSFMNGSKDTVCGSGSSQSLPVHHCTDTNLRSHKNRWTKSAGRNLSISDDSCAEHPLGFSDVPVEQYSCEDPITGGILCPSDIPIEQDSLENPVTDVLPPNIKTPNADSNKSAAVNGVVEGVKVIPNLSSSESRNVSVELFDTWDSGNCTKSGTTFERPPENKETVVFIESQVSGSEEPCNHSETSCKDVCKHHHLPLSSVDINESDCRYPRDETELLRTDNSKEHLFPERSNINSGTGKLSSPAKIESTIMSVKKLKSLRRQSSRRLSHQVVPSHRLSVPQGKLPSFHDVYDRSACITACSDITVAVPEDADSLELCSIAEASVSVFTARDAVLQQCCQHAPVSFSEVFPASYWLTCKKIGEGVYGEVFLSEGQEMSVLKIIPIEGEIVINGEPQKKFEEILSEIVIAMELSGLRNGTENRTSSFSEVKCCLCVQGAYPEKLIELWDNYDKAKGSENDSPAVFKEDQLYIILVLTHGGYDLEAHVFTNAEQSYSALIQTSYALAVAEQVLEFEHRDLHWGNVLVSRTTKKNITFKLCGKEYTIPTKGVQVTVIDFTLSRMTYDGCCIFNDLSKDPALFAAEGDYQFEVYRLMQKCTMNIWHNFNPYTNLLWLHYLLDKMSTMVTYHRVSSKSHKQGMKKLMKLQDVVLKYKSTQDFVLNEVV